MKKTMNPSDFWSPFEETIDSFESLSKAINEVFTKWSSKSKLFAWRGQVDSNWPLHSSLYRRVHWTKSGTPPEEKELYKKEKEVLADVHRWGLHVSPSVGRLSILNQLAALQHYGAPTRLIDVTFNPWIGAWFAVEKKWENGQEAHLDKDARLFAIDVTDRLINEKKELRDWEDDLHRPWPSPIVKSSTVDKIKNFRVWCTKVFAWKCPHFDGRIAAQNGGFIFGGVPASRGPDGPNQWPKGTNNDRWKLAEVRESTSLSLRPHKLKAKHGGVTQNAVYSFKILSDAKKEIRKQLEKNFGYQHSTIYPDFNGFADFGTPKLKTKP
jgi:hypothetical protein